MVSEDFEKLLTNHEILIHLYKMLNFEDQLRLSRVNVQLKAVFESFIWKHNYRVLIINKNSDSSAFVIANETGTNRLCLATEELNEFLRSFAGRVQDLTENRTSILDLKQFPRLSSLSYLDMRIPYQHLKLIAEYCPNLQTLHLSCLTEEEGDFIVIGKNWSIKRVVKLKNLKGLRLQNDEYAKLKYRHFRKIVTKLNMEYMQLKAAIEPDDRVIKADNKFSKPIHLKELDIAATFEPRKWGNNLSWYLSNFENLLSLTIKITHPVTDEILAISAEACKHLETFKIHYTTFVNVKTFPMPAQVTELALDHCRGLDFDVLKRLLTSTKLKRFSCQNPDFEGAFQDFQIAPSLQSLDVEGIDTCTFTMAYSGNENLKELVWYHTLFKDHRDIMTDTSLPSCINLETLDMREGQMSVETLLQLKALSKLTMPYPRPLLGWAYITALLKHSSLAELTIRDSCTVRSPKMSASVPIEGFPTNIIRLQVPLDLFEVALDFWLHLFGQNRNLKLICCKFKPHDMQFLKKLVNHKNFPSSLRTIDVCCFTISCNNLRKQFDDTVEQLQNITVNYYGYEYKDDVFRIILCRENK